MEWVLWFYIIVINIIAFVMMGMDKSKARKGMWRIPERILFILALAGGSLGILWGMSVFHHKTQHYHFRWGIPIIIAVQLVLTFWIWKSPLLHMG